MARCSAENDRPSAGVAPLTAPGLTAEGESYLAPAAGSAEESCLAMAAGSAEEPSDGAECDGEGLSGTG